MTEVPKSVDARANSAWWAYKHYHPKSSEDSHASFVFAYRRATTDMMADQFGFAGWDLLTRRLLDVLEDLVIERQARNMVDEATGEIFDPDTAA